MQAEYCLSSAVWVWPDTRSFVLEWTKSESMAIAHTMTGRPPNECRITDISKNPYETVIVIGSTAIASLSPRSDQAGHALEGIRIEADALDGEEYLVRTIIDQTDSGASRRIVAIAGGSDQALCWGCFHFLEALGCEYRISNDIIPIQTDPVVPMLTDRCRPAHEVRGIWFSYCFATNSIMSMEDYRSFFGQMVKLKLNRFITYHFENEPFMDYSFRGERKVVGDISHPTSGYISYGRHFSGSYLVEDTPIGAELFGRKRVAPLELQNVRSSDEALTEGVRFMRSIHRTARNFGIPPWISVVPSFVPMNFTKYTRRMPRPHMHWSALVSFTDPVLDEMNRNRIEAIVHDYPEIEGLNLGIPEGYYEDPYPDSVAIIERERPRYREALELHKRYWGKYWNDNQELLDAHIDRDIGFVEILKRSIDIAREVAPNLKLGVMTVCKAYLLTLLHEDLPTDISFSDIESRSLWTVDGAPLHLFDRMKDRECTIIPRAVDDGSMGGLQHNLELYTLDRFLQSPVEHGTSGLVIQTTHIRGNEHNLGFLSKGMWKPDLNPSAYYRDYARHLVGEHAAEHLEKAFAILEKNEQELGGRGQGNLPWNKVPMHIEILRKFRDYTQPFFGVPYNAGFVTACQTKSGFYSKAIERLDQAAKLFSAGERAISQDSSGSMMSVRYAKEIEYLIEKNAAYRNHLQCLIDLADLYAELFTSLVQQPANRALSPAAIRMGLNRVMAIAENARNHSELSATHFARAVDHVTDLGVLWSINSSMVIGTRLLNRYIANVRRFYLGEEYWEPISWEQLFDRCPYPAYTLDEMELSPEAIDDANSEYEPG